MKGHVAVAACVLHPKQNQDGGNPHARPPWELQWPYRTARESPRLTGLTHVPRPFPSYRMQILFSKSPGALQYAPNLLPALLQY